MPAVSDSSGALKDDVTTREAAEMLGVSLRTAQLWVERGRLRAWKTAGGHRRIERASVEALRSGAGAGTEAGHEGGAEAGAPLSGPGRLAPSAVKPSEQPLRVVAVEDDKTLQSLYRIAIGAMPFPTEVHVAANGFDGLILIGKVQPDVVILDLNLPGMDGFRLIRELDRHEDFDTLEIVVVSALSQAEIRDRGDIPDTIEIFTKPLAMSQLELFLSRSRRRFLDRHGVV
ncbi:response regulator [Oxalobacteraceae bacterium CAVE-383]|nr:response regulator [Oxalobacteraceae bacterium CAVE-383]